MQNDTAVPLLWTHHVQIYDPTKTRLGSSPSVVKLTSWGPFHYLECELTFSSLTNLCKVTKLLAGNFGF